MTKEQTQNRARTQYKCVNKEYKSVHTKFNSKEFQQKNISSVPSWFKTNYWSTIMFRIAFPGSI